MTDRKFHRTVIAIEVLSEEPIPSGMELEDIATECKDGDWSMRCVGRKEFVLDGPVAAKALINQGSDPLFF